MVKIIHKKEETAKPIEFITIGVILGAWGLKGALKVRPTTDFPERLMPGEEIFLNGRAVAITSTVWQKNTVLIKLLGIDTPEDAAKLHHKTLDIPSSTLRELPEWQYYQFDIIGLEVCTTTGTILGIISEILNCGNDVYVVHPPSGKDILIPATRDVIKRVDIKKGLLVIEPIVGLLE